MQTNVRFVDELRSLYEGQVTVPSVTGLLKPFVDHLFTAYITYCSNTSLQQEIITQKRWDLLQGKLYKFWCNSD